MTAGAAALSLPIPPIPAIVGTVVYFQWFSALGPVLAPPGSLSRGLQVTVL